MNRFILLLSLLLLTFSCKRSDTNNLKELSGSWRMVLVTDITTGASISKPSTINGEVDITFISVTFTTGTFNGRTPTNSLSGEYSIGGNSTISIPAVSATKVIETTWGSYFLDNVTSSHNYFFAHNGRSRCLIRRWIEAFGIRETLTFAGNYYQIS